MKNSSKLFVQILNNYNNFYSHIGLEISTTQDGYVLIRNCTHSFHFLIPLLESLKYHTISYYLIEGNGTISVKPN